MIMTFCSYARILEDLFQFDSWYTSVAYGRPLTTKTSNVTYLVLTLHQRYTGFQTDLQIRSVISAVIMLMAAINNID